MKYLMAVLLPPIGMMMCGRLVHATVCGALWLLSLITIPFGIGVLGLALCALWGLIVVGATDSVRQNLREMEALDQRHHHQGHPPVHPA